MSDFLEHFWFFIKSKTPKLLGQKLVSLFQMKIFSLQQCLAEIFWFLVAKTWNVFDTPPTPKKSEEKPSDFLSTTSSNVPTDVHV